VVDTSLQSAGEAADKILAYLTAQGYLGHGSTMQAEQHKIRHEPITLWTSDSGSLPQTLSSGDAASPPGAGKRLYK